MEAIAEIFIGGCVLVVYGAKGDPRPPAIRNGVRLLFFGGLGIALLAFCGVELPTWLPEWLVLPWALAGVVMAFGEWMSGSRRIALATWLSLALLPVLVFNSGV